MAEIVSTVEKLTLKNGETVDLTMNFAKLLWLRANGYEKEVAASINAINGKDLDFLEMPYFLYGAYLCGFNHSAGNEPLTQQQFIELLAFDMEEISTIFSKLIKEKKTEVSKMRSSAAGKKAK